MGTTVLAFSYKSISLEMNKTQPHGEAGWWGSVACVPPEACWDFISTNTPGSENSRVTANARTCWWLSAYNGWWAGVPVCGRKHCPWGQKSRLRKAVSVWWDGEIIRSEPQFPPPHQAV